MKLEFNADKKKLTEGEIIELNWNAPECQTISLTIDNGYKAQSIPLSETKGSKKFRLNRSKRHTKLTLYATCGTDSATKTIKVKVKEMKATRAETLYEERPHRNPFRRNSQPKGKLGAWMNNQRNRFSYNWRLLSPKKQMAYVILSIMTAGLLVSLISPRLWMFTNTAILIYLAIVLIKK